MGNEETLKMLKDGEEVTANVITCLELENGKTYLLYSFENDEEVYASLMVETDEEIQLLDVPDEEMKMLDEALEQLTDEKGE